MKRRSATRMRAFLPNLSANRPVIGLARRALRLVHDVMRLLSSVVKGWPRSRLMDTRVEEITPVLEILQSIPKVRGRGD